ncbi:hypothetical protein SmJEL517_g03186 [Synchytrium microbalum]|uniref:Uncharacterized protein n=1 Tax=Synchytrium microbalum TaxID=1806994 RepID=A0A507C4K5_9FUNG|nr:uncharacterized protein SmJEL517_g03186 [Synchytrium microbalum]TPX34039.1 hypothetical protein SmJEL517_g03186 [Synchytrium microbalum]
MKTPTVLMALAVAFESVAASSDYSNSTDTTSNPNNVVLDGAYETTGASPPANLPVWKSKIQPTCEASVVFTVDWSAKFGAVQLSTVRFEWGTRPAGNVTLSAINNGVSNLTPAILTANSTDGYYYLNAESTGMTPTATAAKLTFTNLKAGTDNTCYVDLADIDAYPLYVPSAALGVTNRTTGPTGTNSGVAPALASGSVFAIVAVLVSSVFL